jgi:hypothetical protein
MSGPVGAITPNVRSQYQNGDEDDLNAVVSGKVDLYDLWGGPSKNDVLWVIEIDKRFYPFISRSTNPHVAFREFRSCNKFTTAVPLESEPADTRINADMRRENIVPWSTLAAGRQSVNMLCVGRLDAEPENFMSSRPNSVTLAKRWESLGNGAITNIDQADRFFRDQAIPVLKVILSLKVTKVQ